MERVSKNIFKVVSSANKSIAFEASKLARFSNGSCVCSLGDTSVLVTAVSHQSQKPSAGFVPLSVEYKQKAAAAGRIPTTHLRRDVGIIEKEVLTGRMIDRSIRPAFMKGFRDDTQIICNLLAVDGDNDPDVLAINGASASLAISDIPWRGPIGAVRMGLLGEKLVVNPSRREQLQSRINLVLASNNLGNIIMMDGSCREPVLMPDILKVIKNGLKECKSIIDTITKLQATIGKAKRPLDLNLLPNDDQKEFILAISGDEIKKVLSNFEYDKATRDAAMKIVREESVEAWKAKFSEVESTIFDYAFLYAIRKVYFKILTETHTRCDGRHFGEMRPIDCKINLHKPLHGSALFQRGQTQVFCSTTFDSPDAAFRTDPFTSIVDGIKEKNFMLHYEFPPYATNDIKRVGSMPDRREMGHGALAEKAIRPLVPSNHEMTIRLNCEVLESNGSSSMASVCAGSLSLMDAGVYIQEHVAGVAMGLFSYDDSVLINEKPDESKYTILTDILGFEDFIGDMDFKIAGTKKALTALQLDVKPLCGVPATIVYQAIQKAHVARTQIIAKMDAVIKSARKEKKDNHPVMKTIHIPPHKIASFVGFAGSNLKKLMATIGVRISAINDGTDGSEIGSSVKDNFTIFAPNKDAMQEAEEHIKTIVERQREPELEFNAIYTATIQEIRPDGVMVTLYSSMKPTLLRLSQLDIRAVSHPSALNLEVGQQIQVKYFGRDPATGYMRLSRKSLLMSSVTRIHRTPPS